MTGAVRAVSQKTRVFEGFVEFLAIDITKNEFPELYEGSYQRFPSHEVHERVILVQAQRARKFLYELDTHHIEGPEDVLEFIFAHIR